MSSEENAKARKHENAKGEGKQADRDRPGLTSFLSRPSLFRVFVFSQAVSRFRDEKQTALAALRGVTPRMALCRAARRLRFRWVYPAVGNLLHPRRPLPPCVEPPRIARLEEFAARAAEICPESAGALIAAAETAARGEGRYLNLPPVSLGRPIDWNLSPYGDKLWAYCLHYFDETPALLAAFLLTGRDEFRELLLDRIGDWIAHTTPGQPDAWEPYPISRRLPHWCLLYSVVSGGTALAGSIRQQARFLCHNLERDIGNNHLISNACALLWCAAALPQASEAPRWHRLGVDLLAEELARQVHPDGGHWENTPGYHRLVLQDVLEAALALRDALGQQPPELWTPLERMFEALAALMLPDGTLPAFNDTTPPSGWTAPELLALGAALFERGDWKAAAEGDGRRKTEDGSKDVRGPAEQGAEDDPRATDTPVPRLRDHHANLRLAPAAVPPVSEAAVLWWLGEAGLAAYRDLPALPLSRRFQILPHTGCAIFRRSAPRSSVSGLRSSEEADPTSNTQHPSTWQQQPGGAAPNTDELVLLDCGAVGPVHCAGHAHADSLSFIYYAAGAVRIADPGVYEYPAGPWRDYFRSTAAHNTVRLDGADSTRFAGPFRVGERAETTLQFWEETPGREQVVASHDGYRRLPGRPVHRRRLRRAGREWILEDEITGRGRHQVELRFQLPGAVVAADTDGARAEYADGWRLRLRLAALETAEASVEPGWHSPDWKVKQPCPVLVYRWHARLPFRVETAFEIGRPVRLESTHETSRRGSEEARGLLALSSRFSDQL